MPKFGRAARRPTLRSLIRGASSSWRLLDDPHPAVRGSVREALYALAQRPDLGDSIRQVATQVLAGDRWRGLEQAALLLAALDHKPAAPRLVELLEFGRPEVGVAAGWGLKKLAVPETLPAMLDKATRQTAARKALSPRRRAWMNKPPTSSRPWGR